MGQIDAKDLQKGIVTGKQSLQILKGLSLSIRKGETVAIMGPSGSGKSTLLSILAGLDRPDGGEVRIDGREITAMNEKALTEWRRSSLGFVFQSFHLIKTLTALENVAVPLRLLGRPKPDAEGRRLLEAVGLGQRLHHYPDQLSGGEQQRVAIARAFAPSPPVIFADEPTGNLDRQTGMEALSLMLHHARANGTTLVIVTHDPAVSERCDRTLHMLEGQLAAEGGSQHAL